MKIYDHIDAFVPVEHAVLTIGTFDGVHVGHRKIIHHLLLQARQCKGETVILTFSPHPRSVLYPQQNLPLITTLTEKIRLLDELGIDHLIIMPFSKEIANLSAKAYISDFLIKKISARKIIIGHDHRFGKNRTGNLSELQYFAKIHHFEVIAIPEHAIDQVPVSSTKIRDAIGQGAMATANKLLGYAFFLSGRVVHGDHIGQQIACPSANLLIEERAKLIPCDGVFTVTIQLGEEVFYGMAYIGYRPTVNGTTRNIEVHMFDFNRIIYGQMLCVRFFHFIRPDRKFDSLDALRQQLVHDKQATLAYFLNYHQKHPISP